MAQTKLPRKTPEETPAIEVFHLYGAEWRCFFWTVEEGFWVLFECVRSHTIKPGVTYQSKWYGDWKTVKEHVKIELCLIENGYYFRLAEITKTESENASSGH